MKKHRYMLLSIIFVGLILLIGVKTVIPNVEPLWTVLKNSKTLDTQTIQQVENTIKENLWDKRQLIDLFGGVEKIAGKHLVGDEQFYKDDEGMMHLSRDSVDYMPLLESVEQLSNQLQQRNIPLLLCQSAERAAYGDRYSKLFDGESLSYIEPLREKMRNRCVYLDYAETFYNIGLEKTDIFFKSDVHYTTDAEFTALEAIVNTLETDTDLSFSNKNTVLDKSNYKILERPFVGNLAHSSGEIYTGVDNFQFLYPLFETSMKLDNSTQGCVKEGEFQEVCMNQYIENGYTDKWTYWVTDYLQYPSPYYTIENHMVDQTNLLVICDSMAFRTVSYLSLMCHSITVLDPRSFGSKLYLADALSSNYDAVVVIATSNLQNGIGASSYDSLNAEILSTTAPTTVNHTSSYDFEVTVKNTGTQPWSELQQNRLCIWQDGTDWGYRLYLPDGVTIEPGDTYTFALQGFVLPEADSTYLEFQMLQEGVCYFGEKQRVDIKAIS